MELVDVISDVFFGANQQACNPSNSNRDKAQVGKVAGLIAGEGLIKHRGLHHCVIVGRNVMCITGPEHDQASAHDAQRIAALWNAFAGVPTEEIFNHPKGN